MVYLRKSLKNKTDWFNMHDFSCGGKIRILSEYLLYTNNMQCQEKNCPLLQESQFYIIHKESLLKAALAYIEELRDHHMPMLRAADLHELRLAFETSNMIISAEMKLRASIMRKESRCSHFRLDYPDIDRINWNAWINIYKGYDGRMKLEKQPFDSWPA